jgi:hypothetical protein
LSISRHVGALVPAGNVRSLTEPSPQQISPFAQFRSTSPPTYPPPRRPRAIAAAARSSGRRAPRRPRARPVPRSPAARLPLPPRGPRATARRPRAIAAAPEAPAPTVDPSLRTSSSPSDRKNGFAVSTLSSTGAASPLAKLLFNYEHHINVKPSNVHHQISVVRKGTAAIFFILQWYIFGHYWISLCLWLPMYEYDIR